MSVRLEQVAKAYRFYQRPGDRLREWLTRKPRHLTHWALKDVDISVEPGETFGLVGENGAGKSTLLKIIAGTCKPSAGRVTVDGRIAALLELGAGFHPEQNGRDNVYLMGAISGVPPRQMAGYYEQIAAFSELPAEALARPVKTYSSGMFMRLAFATATAVDPDVLIIDEALSVGDMHFQKKSLNRIMEFRERGKTVLFCSHNMYQIRSLCQRAAWLHEGVLQAQGDTESVVTAYESFQRAKDAEQLAQEQATFTAAEQPAAMAGTPAKIAEAMWLDAAHIPVEQLESFQPATVRIVLESRGDAIPFHVGVAIVRNDKENVFGTSTHFDTDRPPLRGRGEHIVELQFPELPLLSGHYWLSVYALDDSGLQVYDMAEKICRFTVHNPQRDFGLVYMPHRWLLDTKPAARQNGSRGFEQSFNCRDV